MPFYLARGRKTLGALIIGLVLVPFMFVLPAEATHNGCSVHAGSLVGDRPKCSYVATGPGVYSWTGTGTWKITIKRGRKVVRTITSENPFFGEWTDTEARDLVTLVIMSGQGLLAAGDSN